MWESSSISTTASASIGRVSRCRRSREDNVAEPLDITCLSTSFRVFIIVTDDTRAHGASPESSIQASDDQSSDAFKWLAGALVAGAGVLSLAGLSNEEVARLIRVHREGLLLGVALILAAALVGWLGRFWSRGVGGVLFSFF